MDTKEILNAGAVAARSAPDEALAMLKAQPFEDLGYAKIDHHRAVRQGAGEVIYGAGKTAGADRRHLRRHAAPMRARTTSSSRGWTRRKPQAVCRPRSARITIRSRKSASWPRRRQIERVGTIAVATGGTSDMPVAEEAALTAEALGSHVVRLYDVGVAGLHRLLAQLDELHERPRGHRHRRHGGRAGQRASADW